MQTRIIHHRHRKTWIASRDDGESWEDISPDEAQALANAGAITLRPITAPPIMQAAIDTARLIFVKA